MIKWDDAITIMQKLGNDESVAATTYLKLMANNGYKELLGEFNSESIEDERSATTTVGRRDYQVPVDAMWLSNLTIISGTTKYPLTEVKSRDTWDRMTSNEVTGIPDFYHIQPRKGVGGGKVSLDPIPGDAYTLKMVFETTAKDLAATAHTDGTVSVARNTVAVTGSSTNWTANMKGRYIRFTGAAGDGLWYRIVDVVPTSALTLEQYYQGPTNVSGETYEIAELFELPEDVHMGPIYFALWHHFASKRDKVQAKIYENQYKELVKAAHERHAVKSRDVVIHGYDFDQMTNDYPNWFPSDGVS